MNRVEYAIENFMLNDSNKFQYWWDSFDDRAKDIYAYLSEASVPIHRKILNRQFGAAEAALGKLRHTGVVRCIRGNKFVVAGEMFRKWFKMNASARAGIDLQDHVDTLLKELERSLRSALSSYLINKYGTKWPERQSVARKKISSWRRNAGVGQYETLDAHKLLMYAHLSDLFEIISSEWEGLQRPFKFCADDNPKKNKTLLEERRELLVHVRNALRHAREEHLTKTDLTKARVFCEEILDQLDAQHAKWYPQA